MRRSYLIFSLLLVGGLSALAWTTQQAMQPFPASLDFKDSQARKLQVLDRNAQALTVTYQNQWNLHDFKALHDIPTLLQQAFIFAEDKRFFRHHGVDWLARSHAMAQNLNAGEVVRGASTITEQCVRILHPRPRTFWSRWVETFEAADLERHFSKADILEFYLNQVPYANQRRGVQQAAQYYFDRDLDTLNPREMLALAVLVRSPSRLDLHRGQQEIRQPLSILAQRMRDAGTFDDAQHHEILMLDMALQRPRFDVQAVHFVNHVYQRYPNPSGKHLRTTLDSRLQTTVQDMLDQRLHELRDAQVFNGAVLVVDHQSQDILAWVNGGDLNPDLAGSQIDAVATPRQPGSTLKPFVYALALSKGWHAATLLDDIPLTEAVGQGLHSYRNYSRTYYGPLRLRDALGNSLNIPAVKTAQFVGADTLLHTLQRMGMNSLSARSDFYGDGLALGNGEVSLLELVQAYTVLARDGAYQPLRVRWQEDLAPPTRIFSPEVAQLIADILSDSDARRLEFGSSGLLRFPVQTAIKTGTSSDYRDAWAVGFNYRYTVGVWLGNLDRRAMRKVSGANGPALLLRSVFAELTKHEETQPLRLSRTLRKIEICRATGTRADGQCASREEWFIPGNEPAAGLDQKTEQVSAALSLTQPMDGVQLAQDPRIPDTHERFMLRLPAHVPTQKIEWWMDDNLLGTTFDNTNSYPWPVSRGTHIVQARVWRADADAVETPPVSFLVK